MYSFQSIPPQTLSELIHGKRPFEVEIPDSVTNFKSHGDFSSPKEVPPTPLILTAEGIAQVLVHSGNGLGGLYTQFVVFVYALGGKIHYTALPSGNYRAVVSWPNA